MDGLTEMKLGAILTRAELADQAICAVAKDPTNFRMTIPPQPNDTDELICTVVREDIPLLVAEVRRLRDALALSEDEVSALQMALDRARTSKLGLK